jgi:hypothetical protein
MSNCGKRRFSDGGMTKTQRKWWYKSDVLAVHAFDQRAEQGMNFIA